ncbi:MAG: rRNA maturation RNase YbeY [Planctomycetota bacterium]
MPRNHPPAALLIALVWQPRASWHAVPLLRRMAAHVLRAEGFHAGHLSIAVVGARAMSSLHRRYRHEPGPTDVLTFDFGCDLARGWIDAEVVLCADVARRVAATRGGTLRAARAELALYLVHGLLHLAGFSDDTPDAAERMHRREDELLRQAGLGPVYDVRARRRLVSQRRSPR